MNTKIKLIVLVSTLLIGTCFSKVQAQVAFPEIIINLSYPQYQSLKVDRGYKYIEGGSHGIILYRADDNTYVAFERACPYHPYDENATVDVDMSGLYMIDSACKSNFSFPDGTPTAGPARRAMWMYRVTIQGTTLTISDEIIN
jgi:nitrite reductase/ring-hydroxylating ferredoxin subunit